MDILEGVVGFAVQSGTAFRPQSFGRSDCVLVRPDRAGGAISETVVHFDAPTSTIILEGPLDGRSDHFDAARERAANDGANWMIVVEKLVGEPCAYSIP